MEWKKRPKFRKKRNRKGNLFRISKNFTILEQKLLQLFRFCVNTIYFPKNQTFIVKASFLKTIL